MSVSALFPLLALVGMTSLAWFGSTGLDRNVTTHRYLLAVLGGLAGLMIFAQDWILLALFGLVTYNTLRFPWPMGKLHKFTTAGLLYAVYLVLHGAMTPEMRLYVLGLLIAVAYGVLGVLVFASRPQWNPNHAHMGVALGIAACFSMALVTQWAVVVLAIPLVLPLVLKRGQGLVWTAVACTGAIAWEWPYIAMGLIPAAVIALASAAWPLRMRRDGPDHGRMRMWTIFLTLWWKKGWRARWLGFGQDSWRQWADSFQRLETVKNKGVAHTQVWTHPHNEYVHILFEHGVLGLVLFLAWVGSLLWAADPVYTIPAVTLCAIACTCFPWTLPYEVAKETKLTVEYEPFGSMGMVVHSILVLLLL